MIPWPPSLALDRLTEALEVEILAMPEAEVRSFVREPAAQASLHTLRALVMRTVEAAEEHTDPPPQTQTGAALRRP